MGRDQIKTLDKWLNLPNMLVVEFCSLPCEVCREHQEGEGGAAGQGGCGGKIEIGRDIYTHERTYWR